MHYVFFPKALVPLRADGFANVMYFTKEEAHIWIGSFSYLDVADYVRAARDDPELRRKISEAREEKVREYRKSEVVDLYTAEFSIEHKATLTNEEEFKLENAAGKCQKKDTKKKPFLYLPAKSGKRVLEKTFLWSHNPFATHLRTLSYSVKWGPQRKTIYMKPDQHMYEKQASDHVDAIVDSHNAVSVDVPVSGTGSTDEEPKPFDFNSELPHLDTFRISQGLDPYGPVGSDEAEKESITPASQQHFPMAAPAGTNAVPFSCSSAVCITRARHAKYSNRRAGHIVGWW